MKIAFETFGDAFKWRRIAEANSDQISDPNRIKVGVRLKITKPGSPVAVSRNGEQYLIRQGDTLGTISKDVYGSKQKWKRIWENNPELIKDPNKIFAGFSLYYTLTDEDRKEKQDFQARGVASVVTDKYTPPMQVPEKKNSAAKAAEAPVQAAPAVEQQQQQPQQ